jgi:DNA-binding transcriptional LysR family regulator
MQTSFRSFDLNLLRVFDAVMAEGSLTRAAGTLAMTQPAVSHAVRRLRDAVGDELFVRTAHGVRPTARAEALWPQVREALERLRQALAPGVYNPRVDPVQWRLAMADATAAVLAPHLVTSIEVTQSLANLRILPLTTRDPRRLLDDGEVDLAVGFFPEAVTGIAAMGQDSHLRHTRLYATRYVCVMRRGHPLAGQAMTLDGYCAAHHLLVSFSGRPHGFVDQALAALGRQRRIVLTVNQFFTAGRVVARSDLLTVLPAGFVPATGYADQLVTRELPLALSPVTVSMIWHLRHDGDPAHAWLRQQVELAAAEPQSHPPDDTPDPTPQATRRGTGFAGPPAGAPSGGSER